MRLLFIDTKPRNPNRYISRSVFLALRRNPRVTEAVWASYANAVDIAQSGRFDALVAFDGEEAANAIIERLCALIPKRAIWFTEDPYEYYRNINIVEQFSLIFSNDFNTAKRYAGSAIHLPLAGDYESNFIPVTPSDHRYDIFFAGSAWPNRLEFLKQLKRSHRNLRAKLVLVSNGAISPYIEQYRSDFEFSDGISIRDFCRVANKSLLTLTLPRAFSTNPAERSLASDTPGPRLFETALAGSCQLIDSSLTPQVDSLFDPAKHFLHYRTADDCLSAIDRALEHPADVVRMAQSAQQHARDHHLYKHRAEKLITALIEHVPQRRPAPSPSKRPSVLFIAHNIVESGFYGGAEIYLDYVRRLAKNYDVWTLVPDISAPTQTKYKLLSADGSVKDEFELARPVELGDLTHPEFEDNFQRLLSAFGFDIVHINHTMGFPYSLSHFARAYGAKVVFSLHDYYSICENHNLIGLENRYCEIPERPAQTCEVCLLRTRGFLPGSQPRRLRFLRESFEKIDLILVGSHASSDIFLKMFPQVRDKLVELTPPISIVPQLDGKQRRHGPRTRNEVLHVAWLGNFTLAKGAETALAIFEAMRGRPVNFHIFGRLDDVGDRFQAALEAAANPAVIVHGKYDPGQPPAELVNCDVALFLSPWPETYCITLSEAQAFDLVPIVTTIGAQAERVAHGQNGFHVPVNSADAVVKTLEQLLNDPNMVRALQAKQPLLTGIAPEQFVSQLEVIYAGLTQGRVILPSAALKRAVVLDELDVYLLSPRWLTNIPAPPPPPATPKAIEGSASPSLLARAIYFVRYPGRYRRAKLAFGRECQRFVQRFSNSTTQS